MHRSLLCGLIGAGIQGSLTPAMHEQEAAAQGLRLHYQLIDLDRRGLAAEALPGLLDAARTMDFAGLNITYPCKQAVIPLLDSLSEEARRMGAVNTVVHRDGRLVEHNTDARGWRWGKWPPSSWTPICLGRTGVCRAALPQMRLQGSGHIINITSVAGNFGLPYRSFYSASKAAQERYTEALSTETARFGIKVLTIQPGEFNTNIAAARLRPEVITEANKPGYEKAMAILGGSMHYSRDPDEFAQVVERNILSANPKATYVVAQGVQRMSILLKKILPGRMFERMVRKHYE